MNACVHGFTLSLLQRLIMVVIPRRIKPALHSVGDGRHLDIFLKFAVRVRYNDTSRFSHRVPLRRDFLKKHKAVKKRGKKWEEENSSRRRREEWMNLTCQTIDILSAKMV